MDMTLAGQIVGRILLSYFVVLVIMFLVSNFNLKRAFYHTHRWYGFIALVFIFLVGISSHFYN
ncbi:hypothetical protein GCM10009133_04210 [Cocleimonas flava]|uniref:Uncharacterized protein n=1 Tax=Cocleimonas flava TaxID=634765 RepID=A0A4R1F7X0_9GAMM|nr:hypothetical protein EV695_1289 [Cocleimonas flava]